MGSNEGEERPVRPAGRAKDGEEKQVAFIRSRETFGCHVSLCAQVCAHTGRTAQVGLRTHTDPHTLIDTRVHVKLLQMKI